MKWLGTLLLELAIVSLGLALLMWWDGGDIAEPVGWIFLSWSVLLSGWGVILRRVDSTMACLLGAAAGAASGLLAATRHYHEMWDSFFVWCMAGGAACFLVGLLLAWRRRGRRAG
jgi:hypothetical protein